jgi:hypothetical protein
MTGWTIHTDVSIGQENSDQVDALVSIEEEIESWSVLFRIPQNDSIRAGIFLNFDPAYLIEFADAIRERVAELELKARA